MRIRRRPGRWTSEEEERRGRGEVRRGRRRSPETWRNRKVRQMA